MPSLRPTIVNKMEIRQNLHMELEFTGESSLGTIWYVVAVVHLQRLAKIPLHCCI